MPRATCDDLETAIWIVQHADGSWVVVCASCRAGLDRGWSRQAAGHAADRHACGRAG
jgi:hypothetical protein